MLVRLFSIALVALSLPSIGWAQEPRPLCFRGRPATRCHHFLITETGLVVSPFTGPSGAPANFVFDVGGMVNRGPRRAYGGSVFVVTDDLDRWMFGLRPRARFWLSRHVGLDVAPGVLLGGWEFGFYRPKFPGFSGYAGLTLADWLAVGVQL